MTCGRVGHELVFAGRVRSNIRPYALVAYHNSLLEAADYDATSWVSDVNAQGRFEVHVGELKPGPYELRLRWCCVNGAYGTIKFCYLFLTALELPAASFHRQFLYQRFVEPAREARDEPGVLAGLEKFKQADDFWYRKIGKRPAKHR